MKDKKWPCLAGLSYRQAKKVVVAVIGGTVLLLGVALIVLPGPAFVVIPAGLAILATEFKWARAVLQRAKGYVGGRKKPGDASADGSFSPSTTDDARLQGRLDGEESKARSYGPQ